MSIPSIKREIFSVLLRVCAVVLSVVLVVTFSVASFSSLGLISDGECNIAVLPVEGIIMPFGNGVQYGEFAITPRDVRSFIQTAEEETEIAGLLLEVNSPGGTPVASETIMALIQDTTLPSVALIGDIAASGGYMVASAADTIFASTMSDVGSIGVTMSYLEESIKNEEEGLTYVELSTGAFKDAGSPNKPLSEEERALFERDLQLVHEHFVDIVTNNRLLDREVVVELADGSTMTGARAVEKGLVDSIGGRREARDAFASALDLPAEEIIFCEYSDFLSFL